MPPKLNLVGEKFGRLTVVAEAGRSATGKVLWRCACECGEETVVVGSAIKSGNTQSCGCLRTEPKENGSEAPKLIPGPRVPDLTGETFGRLKVVAFAGLGNGYRSMWRCVCAGPGCENREAVVSGNALRGGHTQSCGCLSRELTVERNRVHGRSRDPLYHVWRSMVTRCTNQSHKSYSRYGGRTPNPVTVCPEWRESLEVFEAYVSQLPRYGEPGMQLDRIDNDLGYLPGNVRWATPEENTNNRRNNRRITFRGSTKTLAEWARMLGLGPTTIRSRLDKSGWPAERALTEGVAPEVLARLNDVGETRPRPRRKNRS